MAELVVLLLGSPRVLHGAQDVSFDTRKAIALLSYLIVSMEAHSRDELAALLWPDYSQVNARAALRRTLSALNHTLAGDSFFLATHNSLAMNPTADIQSDVVEFRRHLALCHSHGHARTSVCQRCVEPLQAAVALYRHDFLTGFTLRDSAPFDEWQLLQAEALRRELAGALARLTDIQSSLGAFDEAITSCRRWVALDRLNEVACRKLMSLYAWSGHNAAALSQYGECVQALERELGVAPLAETTLLYQAIKSHNPPAPPVVASRVDKAAPVTGSTTDGHEIQPAGAAPALLPLMERQAEMRLLGTAYSQVDPNGYLAILNGEAGIGKTRLAEEFMALARARGARTLVSRCFEGEQDLAYSPIVALLREALNLPGAAAALEELTPQWLVEVARLLPELAPAPAPAPVHAVDKPGAQVRFIDGVRQLLQVLSRGAAPGVLLFDDLQWADSATLDLLSYLARRTGEYPLFMMLAWRSASAGQLVTQETHLERLLSQARNLTNCTVLQLSRLSAAAVRDLLGTLPGPVNMAHTRLAERLYAETEGLPFFVTQYLAMLARGEDSDAAWSLPGTARDLLLSRLRAVQETGQQLLSTAAVIGRSFDFDTLRIASGRNEEEAVAGLEEMIGVGLVVETGGEGTVTPTYDFSHDKLRALVYDETSLARRRLLHRRVAEAMLGRQNQARGAGALAAQVAHHYRLAGQDMLAAEYHKLAGEYARSLYANREALFHLQAALALGHAEAGELHMAIGDLHTLLGEYRAAINSYDAAAVCLPDSFKGQIEHRLGVVYGRRGQWELAETHLFAALEAFMQIGQAASSAYVITDWSLTTLQRGAVEQAQSLARSGAELAASTTDILAQARANNALGVIEARLGNNAAARGYLEQSLALAEKLSNLEARSAALNNLALAHSASGEIEQALLLADAALQLCVARGDRHREAAIHNNIADMLHAAGRSGEAQAHITQAVTILGEIGAEAGDLQPAIWQLSEW